MGLIGGIARTAVIAGTATAVSNNVSRRQQSRWAAKEQAYAQPAQGYAEPARGVAAVPPGDDLAAGLDRLTAMKDRGQLTDEEFAAAKAKLLGI